MSELLRSVGSLEEALDVATGKANAQAPHLTVRFYMPLARSLTLEEGLKCVAPQIRERVREGKVELLALARGQQVEPGQKPRVVQYVLCHGTLCDEDPADYWLFDTLEKELELAVLMDGDGLRYVNQKPLSREEAVAQWMAGFLGWSEDVPGLFRLRYALIEGESDKEVGQ